MTDRNGNVVSRRDFKPFGEDLAADQTFRKTTDQYSTATQDKVRQRFTGYQKDIETGLDFAEARMYENRHGRFTAVDPLLASGKSANPQTFNRYTYVLNSPLVNTDPTGLQTNYEPCKSDERCDATLLRDKKTGKPVAVKPDGPIETVQCADCGQEETLPPNEPNPVIGPLINGFPQDPWRQAGTGLTTGVANFFIGTANLLTETGIRANNGFMPTFTPNPFYIQPFGCSGSINCNWQTAGTLAPLAAGPIVGAVARGATITRLGLVSESSNPLRFSQTFTSRSFQPGGPFEGQTIGEVASGIRSGKYTPSQLQSDM
ncbi:MAG: RHS repeat-associated core domain-containing protein [Acidobacteria bacterium]|nr:RHS repeat-associated core domain-containing protein [Acidobacteriota bacterium]